MVNKIVSKNKLKSDIDKLQECMEIAAAIAETFKDDCKDLARIGDNHITDSDREKIMVIVNGIIDLAYYRASIYAHVLNNNIDRAMEIDNDPGMVKCINELIKHHPLNTEL